MPWVLFTIAQGAIEAVEINYIFVDKNQQTETDNIFFLNAENKFRMPLPQYGNS